MTLRTNTRQKYPDRKKLLKIFNTYEELAIFQVSKTEHSSVKPSDTAIQNKIEEIKEETTKTLLALKQKQAVRIPEIKQEEKVTSNTDNSLFEIVKNNPLKKPIFRRSGNFIRYIPKRNSQEDNRYNYEATEEDITFVDGLDIQKITSEEFEKIINFFEKENAGLEAVHPLSKLQLNIHQEFGEKYQTVIIQIYSYLVNKREKYGNKGLLRKYWRAPDISNTDPHVVFRKSREEKRTLRRPRVHDEIFLKKMLKLKKTLTYSIQILRASKHRENLKRNIAMLRLLEIKRQKMAPTSSDCYESEILEIQQYLQRNNVICPEPIHPPLQETLPAQAENSCIEYKNQNIICDFEMACIISTMAEKWRSLEASQAEIMIADSRTVCVLPNGEENFQTLLSYKSQSIENNVILEEPTLEKSSKFKISKFRSRSRFGEDRVFRRICCQNSKSNFEPDWKNFWFDSSSESEDKTEETTSKEIKLLPNSRFFSYKWKKQFQELLIFSEEDLLVKEEEKKYSHFAAEFKRFKHFKQSKDKASLSQRTSQSSNSS